MRRRGDLEDKERLTCSSIQGPRMAEMARDDRDGGLCWVVHR